MSLRVKLYGIILGMAVLGMIIMGGLNYTVAKKQLIELARENLESTAREISKNVAQISERNAGLVKTIRPIIVGLYDQMADDMIIKDTLQQVADANPQIQQIFVGTADGEMLLIPSSEFGEFDDPQSKEWYKLSANDKVTALGPYEDSISGQTVMTYSMHLTGNYGDDIGALGLDVSMKAFQDLVANLKIGKTGNALLIDRNKRLVADANETHLGKKVNLFGVAMEELADKALTGETGIRTVSVENAKRTIYYSPVKGTDLFVFVCQNEQEILAPANSLFRNAMITILISTIVLGGIIWMVGHSIILPVKHTAEANKRLAAKDLTVTFPHIRDPLLRQLSDSSTLLLESFQQLMSNLRHTTQTLQHNARGVSQSSERTSSSVQIIEAAMEAVRSMAEATSAAIEETNAGIEEVASGAQTASKAAGNASEAATALRENAEEAGKDTEQTVLRVQEMAQSFDVVTTSVDELNVLASHIGEIVGAITQIADQTNLLALNAAIEAARAGDAGRGFAVVAEEVRKLAEQSNEAASQIGKLAEEILSGTGLAVQKAREGKDIAQNGVTSVEQVRFRLHEVVASINTITELNQDIAEAVQSQSASTEEMAGAIDHVAGLTHQLHEKVVEVDSSLKETGEAAKDMETASGELGKVSAEIEAMVAEYNLGGKTSPPQLHS
ncbi:MAG TPA: methyl-accepting chemotaxis protein [Synergistaceae bacterium]|nr:methyl-accepting chemotaxis protein [Synergistaceae bacterium]HPQ36329.1 methyl-accepting chemotaxis protein [Synergistaceae bacterium]